MSKPQTTAVEIVRPPATDDLRKNASTLVARANRIVVSSPKQYQIAADFLSTIKTAQQAVDARLGPAVKAAHEAHKAVKAIQNELRAPLDEAERALKHRMGEYAAEQERVRLAQERARREEEDRLRREAEAAARKKDRAAAAEAERALEAHTAAPPPPTTVPFSQTARVVKRWRWEITDAALLPREYLVPNEQALNAVVQALKDKANIPGIRVYEDTNIASTGRRNLGTNT